MGIGEAARAVLGLRLALDGPQDESDDSPATTRSREEFDAEDVAIVGADEARRHGAEPHRAATAHHPGGVPGLRGLDPGHHRR